MDLLGARLRQQFRSARAMWRQLPGPGAEASVRPGHRSTSTRRSSQRRSVSRVPDLLLPQTCCSGDLNIQLTSASRSLLNGLPVWGGVQLWTLLRSHASDHTRRRTPHRAPRKSAQLSKASQLTTLPAHRPCTRGWRVVERGSCAIPSFAARCLAREVPPALRTNATSAYVARRSALLSFAAAAFASSYGRHIQGRWHSMALLAFVARMAFRSSCYMPNSSSKMIGHSGSANKIDHMP